MKIFSKRNRAVKKWHSRAMVIDVRKTRVTFTGLKELSDSEDIGSDAEHMPNSDVSQPASSDKNEYQPWY